jgi:hypothetical protein
VINLIRELRGELDRLRKDVNELRSNRARLWDPKSGKPITPSIKRRDRDPDGGGQKSDRPERKTDRPDVRPNATDARPKNSKVRPDDAVKKDGGEDQSPSE